VTNNRRIERVCFSLGLLGMVGCGGETDSVAIQDFPVAGEEAFCKRKVRCGEYADQASCKTAAFVRLQLVADVDSGKVTYDGKAAAACLRILSGASCTEVPDMQPCLDTFQGTIANGGACLEDQECVSGNCNTGPCTAACCPGTCQARIALGQRCDAEGAFCEEGAFCKTDPQTGASTCVAPIALGQPCVRGVDQCEAPGSCLPGAVLSKFTCIRLPRAGQPCPAGVCAAAADYCDRTTETCLPRIAVGESCAKGSCVRYASCNPTTLKCVERAAGGGSCGAAILCVGGLSCQDGTCVSASDELACP